MLNNHNYNPDVLTCIANLSSDEVFTPPQLVNQILDLLPTEIWNDKEATFLDPGCKSGVFLREIAKRLDIGLEKQIADRQKRMNHIFKNQLFGLTITELTALLSRRSVYCSKTANGKYSVCETFDEPQGNICFERIEHTWENGRCVFCGANQEGYKRGEELETHAYQFIHTRKPEEIFNMKFDVIIGNPPYQLSDGGSGTGISAKPIYHYFVEQAKKLKPRFLLMIIPSRWFAGGKGLDKFREEMLGDDRIRVIIDFQSSKDCFNGVNIAGGVCYFLWERDNPGECIITNYYDGKEDTLTRRLNEYPVFVRDNTAVKIIDTVMSKGDDIITNHNFTRNPFNFVSKERGRATSKATSVKLISSAGVGYVERRFITKNTEVIDKYKVTIGKVVPSNGEVDTTPKDGYKVITSLRILEPGEIHTESYLLLSVFDTALEAQNFAKYMTLKLPRFLLKQTLTSMNIAKNNFRFVPYLDYTHEWTDEELYQRYRLTTEQREWVNYCMRPMNLGEETNV
ncbi:MAG: Eco57I restriction-modification methylase domain-containing protein [Deltaproteobacteria bacterium]|nr:Eco57I restriction-modification methylase domain-containing protein [Deltaproteobacteria bacterium]